jgi:secreted PhoX family phosphatase
MRQDMNRRRFLTTTVSIGAGLALAGPLQAFMAKPAWARQSGYGPLKPVKDHRTDLELLALPKGFEYWSYGEVGSLMSDGRPTPPSHDGTASFQHGRKIHLVRNHEVRGQGVPFGPLDQAYDPLSGGGNTITAFDPRHPSQIESWAVLSGTNTNCAGGRTPRQSWLTCEETLDVFGQPHGFVFEVPSDATSVVDAVPLKALGRFAHEAVAVDPATWIVYLTEDAGSTSGLYRFIPKSRGDLTSGRLQMLAIEGQASADLFTGQTVATELPVEWVDIDVPVPDPVTATTSVFAQGRAQGAAAFRRLEGAWYSADDQSIYFNSTDGGNAAAGQVWALTPGRRSGGRKDKRDHDDDGQSRRDDSLALVYESPSTEILLKPDNITVSPSGGVLLCEDTDRARQTFLRGLTADGVLYDFAANNRTGLIPGTAVLQSWDEFTGATFSADGEWLFVNIQTPGISFAITGPFDRGPLGGSRGRKTSQRRDA